MRTTAAPEENPDAALDARLAERLAALRSAAGWSLDELATRSGISRATLSRLERAETSPTASLLNRLCAAHGLTMSRLLADVESAPARQLPAAQQPVWQDEASGFTRRMLAPPLAGFATELIEGRLRPGARVAYEHPPVPGLEQHLWLISGRLNLHLGELVHELRAGDSLSFKLWGASAFEVPGASEARYLIAITHPR